MKGNNTAIIITTIMHVMKTNNKELQLKKLIGANDRPMAGSIG